MIICRDGTQSRRYVHSTGSDPKIATARDEVDVRGGVTDPYGSPESVWGFTRDALPLAIDPNDSPANHLSRFDFSLPRRSKTVLPANVQHRSRLALAPHGLGNNAFEQLAAEATSQPPPPPAPRAASSWSGWRV